MTTLLLSTILLDVDAEFDEVDEESMDFFTSFLEGDLTEQDELLPLGSEVFLESAISEDGEEFEQASFIITSFFKQNGDVFAQGGGFKMNLSELFREIVTAAK